MIAFFMSKAGAYVLGALAAVALLWGAYTYVDHQAYQRAAVEYQARLDTLVADYKTAKADEVERVARVNDATKAAEARAIAEMQVANDALTKQLQEQADEADKDPDAARPAFGADSVRRLNAIH
jgi:predicted negative regulator of RcsB-dependent stress response